MHGANSYTVKFFFFLFSFFSMFRLKKRVRGRGGHDLRWRKERFSPIAFQY